jgi:predicted hotdog family 3-hydroxylacyl-ACP dehydratase
VHRIDAGVADRYQSDAQKLGYLLSARRLRQTVDALKPISSTPIT